MCLTFRKLVIEFTIGGFEGNKNNIIQIRKHEILTEIIKILRNFAYCLPIYADDKTISGFRKNARQFVCYVATDRIIIAQNRFRSFTVTGGYKLLNNSLRRASDLVDSSTNNSRAPAQNVVSFFYIFPSDSR